jgi:tRNA modification GTPase
MKTTDTIAAIATPPGSGGIAVIRISGDEAQSIANKLFKPSRNRSGSLKPRRVYNGSVIDPESSSILDTVMVTFFKKPYSYTGEDIVEIACHGSPATSQAILSASLKAGAVPAPAGEFTRRAFENGKMDLSQAEAVVSLTAAESEQERALALKILSGGLSRPVDKMRQQLLTILGSLELDLDFPEEEPSVSYSDIKNSVTHLQKDLEVLIRAGFAGDALVKDFRVVLLGKVNVGKSRLFNALLGRERAIVTSEPGTTRDSIEGTLLADGIAISILDTAGLRQTMSLAESEGIRKTRDLLSSADLILFVIDGADPEPLDSLPKKSFNANTIALWNKSDIAQQPDNMTIRIIENCFGTGNWMEISAKTGDGLADLRQRISHSVRTQRSGRSDTALYMSLRQKQLIEKTRAMINEVVLDIDHNVPPECLVPTLRTAYQTLGEIVGDHIDPDVLNSIFSRFCIGK